ncbi:MAG: VCBS repeat-containing protein, partial [Dysgonamonadaceae bacterium]|nr:VCBS repeat-containing protein [Dysgonamonadaceae bacterium]
MKRKTVKTLQQCGSLLLFLLIMLTGIDAQTQTWASPWQTVKAVPQNVFTNVNTPKTIDVLTHSSLGYCGQQDITLRILTVPGTLQHGTATISYALATYKQIIYTPATGYVGQDQFQFAITCGRQTSYATITINIVGQPDNVVTDKCQVPMTAKTFAIAAADTFPGVDDMSTPLVADLDGDGVPEIIAPRAYAPGNPWISNGLVIGNAKTHTYRTIMTDTFAIHGQSIAIGDVDRDGIAEIYIQQYRTGQIKCYTPTGAAKAGFTTTVSPGEHYIIQLADLNCDGNVELVAGSHIFNARTGALLLQMTLAADGKAFGNPHNLSRLQYGGLDGYYFMPIVGDVDGDGILDIAAGSTVYFPKIQANATNTTGNTYTTRRVTTTGQSADFRSYLDGPTLLLDFDGDGMLDVCVVGHSSTTVDAATTNPLTTQFYVWNPRTSQIIGYSDAYGPFNSRSGISIPYAGDLDGNGYVDFALAYRGLGLVSWQYDPSAPHSVRQGPNDVRFAETAGFTLFDFNQDGKSEIVYRGTSQFFIVDGTTLADLSPPIRCWSGTIAEYPIVADVDGDGQAEIILTRGYKNWSSGDCTGNIAIYKSGIATQPWAPARKVWNQWPYNPVYINEDLTVPRYPLNPATKFTDETGVVRQPFNNFLQQA